RTAADFPGPEPAESTPGRLPQLPGSRRFVLRVVSSLELPPSLLVGIGLGKYHLVIWMKEQTVAPPRIARRHAHPQRCPASERPGAGPFIFVYNWLERNMPKTVPGEISRLLISWSRGDRSALDQLVPVIEGELRRLAAGYLRRERRDHTLQPTAL